MVEVIKRNEGLFMPLLYFEVICAKCGEGLCKLTTVNETNGVQLEIKPCPECLKNAENTGFDKGFSKSCETTWEKTEE